MRGDRGNKERWLKIVLKTKKCLYCPPHDRENRGRRPKDDRGKNHRRQTKE